MSKLNYKVQEYKSLFKYKNKLFKSRVDTKESCGIVSSVTLPWRNGSAVDF